MCVGAGRINGVLSSRVEDTEGLSGDKDVASRAFKGNYAPLSPNYEDISPFLKH